MTIVHFQQVKVRAVRKGKCVNGFHHVQRTTITNTINPFNKNSDGRVKTHAEVLKSAQEEAKKWESQPVECFNVAHRFA